MGESGPFPPCARRWLAGQFGRILAVIQGELFGGKFWGAACKSCKQECGKVKLFQGEIPGEDHK